MNILLKPLVTEKVSELNEKGKYGFIVHSKANKVEIKKAIEKAYGVNVEKVNTINYLGKMKSRYSKARVMKGRMASYKKAIVSVSEGEVIDFYSEI
ncbi:MAG: 50S ribosomal protein L23 [Cyclobacteriaceae bacterium]|nr:50S ribosomal protein L23 [Cyclobacteriaceae bacterium]